MGLSATSNCMSVRFLGWSQISQSIYPEELKASDFQSSGPLGLESETDFVTQSQGKGLNAMI